MIGDAASTQPALLQADPEGGLQYGLICLTAVLVAAKTHSHHDY
jgi:hypothetical protein